MEDLLYKLLENYNIYINEWYSENYSDNIFITVNFYSITEEEFYEDNA